MQHVSTWVKKERIRNRVTGEYEDPDEKLMKDVEHLLDTKGSADEARRQMISSIAAWALDHPGQRVEPAVVFPHVLERIREAVRAERRPKVAKLTRDIVILVREEGTGLDMDRRTAAEEAIKRMKGLGYCPSCAADAASTLLRRRFRELI